jgi:hypothetical protein
MTPDEAMAVIGSWQFEPGTGGMARVPEWSSSMFAAYARAVLSLGDGLEDEAMLCHHLLTRVSEACHAIRQEGEELLPALEREDGERRFGRMWAQIVRARLDDGELPFSNAEIAPVVGGVMTPTCQEGPTIEAFAQRTLPKYQEVDRYGRIASKWAEHLARRARR